MHYADGEANVQIMAGVLICLNAPQSPSTPYCNSHQSASGTSS